MPRDPVSHRNNDDVLCKECGKPLKENKQTNLAIPDNIESLESGNGKSISKNMRISKQKIFLNSIGDNGSIGDALTNSSINYSTYKRWQEDPIFSLLLRDANEKFKGRLEKELIRRAVEGVEEPVVSAGKLVTYKTNYSDSLLQVALKANDKDKYNSDSKKVGAEVGVKEDGTKYMKVYQGFDPDEV